METFGFWFATIVFFGTYILIASEKVHKTTAALIGSSLMLLFVLPGPHNSGLFFDETPGWLTDELRHIAENHTLDFYA